MPITYYLAPNARYQLRDQTGQPAQFGRLETYRAGTLVPQITYQDPEGSIPNNYIVPFDAKGEANIYWVFNSDNPLLYYIRAYDVLDNLIYDEDNYPTLKDTNLPPPPDTNQTDNFVRNPQFTFWSNTTSFPAYGSAANNNDYTADDWSFQRNNTNCTVNISQGIFDLGQTDVPGSPIYYMHYECTNVGAGGETFKYFQQTYQSVQTAAGLPFSFALWAKSDTSSTISVDATQNFGTGGPQSAPVVTNLLTALLTPVWQRFTGTATLPSVSGKVLGTNGDDYLAVEVNMPLNAISFVDFANNQAELQDVSTLSFPYRTVDEQFKLINRKINEAIFYTGDIKTTLASSAPTGWLMMDDGTIGNPSSNAGHPFFYTKALYEIIWNSVINTWAPIYNSDGTIGSRGANAEADFNANKRLALTKSLGRVLSGAPADGHIIKNFTVSGNNLTVDTTVPFQTGNPVILSTTGTLPSPLLLGRTYYLIVIDSTTLQLAVSVPNATSGIPIALTTAGTGLFTLDCSLAPHIITAFTVAGSIITLASGTSQFQTGNAVVLSTPGTLPAPLTPGTVYYLIVVTPTTAKLALSLANALANIAITLTNAGTGTFTLDYVTAGYVTGTYLGEEKHALTINELAQHDHVFNALVNFSGLTPGAGGSYPISTANIHTNTTGQSFPHNIMQPTTFVNVMIKL
jgi:hypothetical protein